ncbi:beta-lactamase domain protein [Desulfatibacillum aliphaticivorans]|uniref:Beta-lactamase domain protein n=1 Tax=Desulfatibacillum aliphaticivorans TaxID=218208 RepID=B8FG01_DESAL|nr:MBL fold metallo-hydrolase [Desulfatibacillum aliphaticivorans]ACL03681.1 beta-lactamase domain protein [Desulfatibacillum aliphaticivorans]
MTEPEKTMDIKTLAVGAYQANCYIVACLKTMEAVVIDPGAEEARIAAAVKMMGCNVKMILATHGHGDHVMGAKGLADMLNVPIAMHEDDVSFFQGIYMDRPPSQSSRYPQTDIQFKDGRIFEIGELQFKVLHTPGHSPGSCCFLCGDYLFTGDTLFVEGVGRTDMGGMTLQDLLNSVESKILPLPGETIILPGHDYGPAPTSTIAREKANNPYIRDFILDK